MESHTFESTVDLSQLLLAKAAARGQPKQVGIIVAPTGDPVSPLVGAVTVDGELVSRASLDVAGAAAFVSQAIIRVNETLPDAQVQVAVEIDGTQIGIPVPQPPPQPHRPPQWPRDIDLVGLAKNVFTYQHRQLAALAARAPGRANRVRDAADHAGARRGRARGKAPARARRRG